MACYLRFNMNMIPAHTASGVCLHNWLGPSHPELCLFPADIDLRNTVNIVNWSQRTVHDMCTTSKIQSKDIHCSSAWKCEAFEYLLIKRLRQSGGNQRVEETLRWFCHGDYCTGSGTWLPVNTVHHVTHRRRLAVTPEAEQVVYTLEGRGIDPWRLLSTASSGKITSRCIRQSVSLCAC